MMEALSRGMTKLALRKPKYDTFEETEVLQTSTDGLQSMSESEFQDADKKTSHENDLSAVQQVFQNDLLLSKIMHFIIDDDDVSRQIKTTNSCKLVQRQWLEKVNYLLQTSPPKWFKVELDFIKEPDRTIKFTNTFSNSPARRIPPFTMKFWFDTKYAAFTKSIYSILLYCIEQCGDGLLKLSLHMDSRMGWSEPQPTPTLYPIDVVALDVPKLECLEVNLYCEPRSCSEKVNEQAKLLLDPILTGCKSLKKFSLLVNIQMYPNKLIMPVIFEVFKLPPTLTTVNFQFEMRPGVLAERLLENPLPNLTTLKIYGGRTKRSIAGELDLVLNKFRHQLKLLVVEFGRTWKSGKSSQPATVVPPAMKCLEVFKWSAKKIQLSAPPHANLESHFPALKKIYVYHQPYDSLRQWLHNARLYSVTEVLLDVYPDEFDELNREDSQLLLQMHRIQQTFPNVVKLNVGTSFTKQFSHIKFIFQEMRHLHELEIRLHDCPEYMGLETFESLFLGLDRGERNTLTTRVDDWKTLTQRNMPDLKDMLIWFVNNGDWFRSSLSWEFEKAAKLEEDEEEDLSGSLFRHASEFTPLDDISGFYR